MCTSLHQTYLLALKKLSLPIHPLHTAAPWSGYPESWLMLTPPAVSHWTSQSLD